MANTYLSRSVSSSGNRQKFTISFWVKRSIFQSSGSQYIISQGTDANNNFAVNFPSSGKLDVWDYGSAYNGRKQTNRIFTDLNGWYHIVIRFDTTLSTADDRMRIYVNGEQETSFSSSTNPSQNYNTHVNQSGNPFHIGYYTSGSEYFDGIVSHFHLCDGYSYGPDSFGSTDATTGEWKINADPSVSYGTNGFFVLKDGNSVTDQSGQGNNLTVAQGTLTKSEDCPSNVFATLNPLDIHPSASTSFANGATTITTNSSGSRSTLGNSTGKFYAEAKISANTAWLGVQDVDSLLTTNDNATMLYPAGASMYVNGSNQGSGGYGSAWSANDIMMIAMDLDSTQKKVYFGKNGGWWNGSDYSANTPTTGENLSNNTTYVYRSDSGSGSQTAYWNFGNGYFGTTAISSEGTNASGIGKFEYNVPTGYTALSTKGLNE